MGIWIRSQSKTRLINAIEAWFVDEEIRAASCSASYPVIGKYDSETEALKVLDEIDTYRAKNAAAYGALTAFQMPPAGFSTQPIELSYSERLSRERYLEFVSELEAEGDPDIPSEGQWRDELKAAIEAEEG